jgi:urease accessory protein
VQPWRAELALDYRLQDGRTVVTRRHRGPLQVQKALYPEGAALAHTLIVHPPAGIAGGDELAIDVAVRPGAQALITTPGATRWYKANGRLASQRVALRVEGGAEWLPQEAIVYDQAQVHSQIDIDLADGAAMLGWDIVALGRAAAGEAFARGAFAQTIALREDGHLQWLERTRLAGGDALLDSPIGLGGHVAFGCLWAAGPRWSGAQIESLRERLPADRVPVTQLAPRLLVARALGATARAVRGALEAAWRELRPLTFAGRAAAAPRIWAT